MPKTAENAGTEAPVTERPGSNAFGRLLREYRLRVGFSQEHLAEKAGMSVNGVGALERGNRHAPHRATVDLLADALGLGEAQRAALEDAAAGARARPRQTKPLPTADLPAAVSSFIGRDDDLANLEALISRFRLVTITGSGGVGKTRVALELARRLRGGRWDEVCFVDLAPLADGSFVAAKIAASLHPPPSEKPDSIADLVGLLSGRAALLILDTCEHLIGDAAAAARMILESCSRLTIVATSRERLQLAGEALYRLPSLPVDAALDLFIERAREVNLGIAFSPQAHALVLDVCRRLDGIPLAIELAAARLPALGIGTLHARLEEQLAVSGGRRDLPLRQQTVLGTIAWSYDLLSKSERQLLRRLGVFSGGFTLEAAEIVCGSPQEDGAIVHHLSSLVDKSLVEAARNDDSVRYRLLDSVRAYALQELVQAGEAQTFLRLHARWLAEIGDRFAADAGFMTYAQCDELSPEMDNVRAALSWSLDAESADDRALAAPIIFGLRNLWQRTGHFAGHRRWIERALQRVGEDSHAREFAQLLRALILRSWAEPSFFPTMERTINILQRSGDNRALASLHSSLAIILGALGRFAEAEHSAERAASLMAAESMHDTLAYIAFLDNREGYA